MNDEKFAIAAMIVAALLMVLAIALLTPRPAPASKSVREQAEKFVESSKESSTLESIRLKSERESENN